MNIFKGRFNLAFITLWLAAITFLLSCKKNDSAPVVTGNARVMVIHASPGKTAYHLTLNGVGLSARPLSYGNFIGYTAVPSGNAHFIIFNAGTGKLAAQSLFHLEPNTAYSIFITDTMPNPGLYLIKDDLSASSKNKARLRFVNLNADQLTLNLSILGSDSTLFPSVQAKFNSPFVEIDPATAMGFSLTGNSGSNDSVISSKYRIEQGNSYTIVAKGLSTGSGNIGLTVGMINNK